MTYRAITFRREKMQHKLIGFFAALAIFLSFRLLEFNNRVKNLEALLSQCESQRTVMLERIIEMYGFYLKETI